MRDDLRGLAVPLTALFIPILFALAGLAFPHGMIEFALSSYALVFWTGFVVWLVAVGLSLRKRQWWALLTAPFALYPLGISLLLLAACSQGNCL